MDELDKEILRILQSEGRISMADLAARINLTVAPTYRRVHRLEEAGYIKGYGAVLDQKRLGLGIRAILSVRFASHDIRVADRFLEFVGREDVVLQCDNVTGEVDYMLLILAKDLEDYEAFTQRLRAVEGVMSLQTHISLKNFKSVQALPIK